MYRAMRISHTTAFAEVSNLGYRTGLLGSAGLGRNEVAEVDPAKRDNKNESRGWVRAVRAAAADLLCAFSTLGNMRLHEVLEATIEYVAIDGVLGRSHSILITRSAE
jgi:hypothetical protein